MLMSNANRTEKTGIVVGQFPEQYNVFDARLNKPVCFQELKNGEISGSMLLQDYDTVKIDKNKDIPYFCPNNIAILLACNYKSIENAKSLYTEVSDSSLTESEFYKIAGDKIEHLNKISSKICDYIESIQTAIVFGYTALEAFANLSVPEDYSYETKKQ